MHDFLERLKNMPTWQKVLLGVGLVAVVGIALYVRSQQSAAASSTTGTSSGGNTTGSSGLLNGAYDIYGNPLYGNQTPTNTGSTPPTGTTGPTPPTAGTPIAVDGPVAGSPPNPPPSTVIGTIRAQGLVPAWDSGNSGVPLRSATNGYASSLGLVPFGSQVTITGSPVSGGSNFATGGSTLWYPVTYNGQNGYVSGYDLSAFSGSQSSSAGAA